ncbi:hypothetical protein BASA62_004967 [Batrachochytrium salamandrivorans]|nr:hypothetical protein BASA62_004967 [Batrachochytrium salamandrivorans]
MLQPSPSQRGYLKQYSSNADITLASGLEARSYQPVLNSHKDSATLMSLERRVDSGGASGGNSGGSGPPSPPLLTPEDVKDIIASFFKDNDFSSANISSTIDRVQDGIVGFYKDGEKAEKEIGGTAGAMLKRYLERAFIAARAESAKLADKKEREVTGAVLNILAKTGTVIENVNTIHTSFGDLFNNRIALFTLLGSPLKDFEATKVLYGYISNAVTSLTKFLADQQNIHDGIIKALEPPPPK